MRFISLFWLCQLAERCRGVLMAMSNLKGQYSSGRVVDVAVIGAGIGGLSSAAILNSNYGIQTEVFESHYHPGGCAHSFPMKSKQGATYNFDAGPTILLGCSGPPYNPLIQVLDAVGAKSEIEWIKYDSWGMRDETGSWNFELGPGCFEDGPLHKFGGKQGREEFLRLRTACEPLCAAAAEIPTMALRGGKFELVPLLPHYQALQKVIPYASELDGSFEAFMDKYVTRGSWLESWLDALAFSLSGLPARRTGAAAMAYTLFDLHREAAALDYPRGGVGKIANTLVKVTEETGGKVHLRAPVRKIVVEKGKALGILLESGEFVRCRRGVLCNAPIWALDQLLEGGLPPQSQDSDSASGRNGAKDTPMTKSFLHLHLGLDTTGLDIDAMQPHYTVMSQGLHNGGLADPCADRNMVCVSNPSVIDSSLVDRDERIVVHAYSAGNEDFEQWAAFEGGAARGGEQYKTKKHQDCAFLYTSVSRALGIDVEEVKERAEIDLQGTPLTHQHFNRRHRGTYGATWDSMLREPDTGIQGLFLAGDSVFPGIGIPAVAVSGAKAANSMVSVGRQLWTGLGV